MAVHPRRRSSLHLSSELLPLFLASLLPFLWIRWSGLAIGLSGLIGIALFSLTSWVVGNAFHLLVGSTRLFRRSFPLTYVTGASLVSVTLFQSKMIIGWSLTTTLCLLLLLAVIYLWVRIDSLSTWRREGEFASMDLAASVLSLVAATFASWHLFPERVPVEGGVKSVMFIEYYAHVVNVLPLLGEGTPSAFGSPHFAGAPWSFYHLGSHLLPAYVFEWTGLPLASLAGGIWYPFGYALMGMGASVLGKSLFGAKHGLWPTVVVAMIPDPTYWSWRVIPFSFDLNVECTPAAGLALAMSAVAVAMVYRGARSRSISVMTAGYFLALLVLFVRANFLFSVVPTCFVTMILARHAWPDGWTIRAIGVVALLGLIGFFVGKQLQSAPTTELGWRGGETFAEWAAQSNTVRSVWTDLVPKPGEFSWFESVIRRSIFLLLGTFQGGLYVGLAVGAIAWTTCRVRLGIRLWPIALLSMFVLVALFAMPNQNGDPFEIHHRPFVWYYLALATWTSGMLGRLLGKRVARPDLISLAFGLLMMIPAYSVGSVSQIPMDPSEHFLPTGLLRATDCLKENLPRQERFVDSRKDPLLISTALAERPAFVCWKEDYNFPGLGKAQLIREERWRAVDELLAATTLGQIRDWTKRYQTRWVLVHPDSRVAWPGALVSQSFFEHEGYRVYDLAEFE
jgi:xanthosine utilization system XapX-like protein